MKAKNEQNPVSLRKAYVGLLEAHHYGGVVRLDQGDPEIGREIVVVRKHLKGAPFGMKVVVRLLGSSRTSFGEIVEVLGDPERPDVAILGILRHYGLPASFPEEVLDAVAELPNDPSEATIAKALEAGREDWRDAFTVTIDGLDARDLDDAISIEERPEGGYRLAVHIADVAHYVKEGGKLDQEAYSRGNSVYLADRVLPMLPPKLSNGLCSLNPGVPRLALSCVMDLDAQGKRLSERVVETVIQSDYRSNYDEVLALIEGREEGVAADCPDALRAMTPLLGSLNRALVQKRQARGELRFDFPELEVTLDKDGVPTALQLRRETEAHALIASFMIEANEAVAEFTARKHIQGIYRVHEEPDPEKMEAFIQLCRRLGVKAKVSAKPRPMELQKLMESFKDLEVAETLSMLLLRSLAKARYAEVDLGHFGLASKAYAHFTAPIRRFSDLSTHRQIKAYLKGTKPKGDLRARAFKIAKHVSLTERIAMAAERDSVDQKVAEYYAARIGEEYKGRISGFARSSLFIRLDEGGEGGILYQHMPEEGYYDFIEDEQMLMNRQTGRRYFIGDKVKVRIANVNVQRRFVDLALLEHQGGPQKPMGTKKTSKKAGQKKKQRGR